jgi:hypothetical protein
MWVLLIKQINIEVVVVCGGRRIYLKKNAPLATPTMVSGPKDKMGLGVIDLKGKSIVCS